MTTPARAGTSAVVAVLGAAGLLLVLVTWAASIGPDRVVSGGHVEPVQADEPTVSRQRRRQPSDPIEEARNEKRGEPPGWLAAIAFVVEILTIGVVLFLVGRLLRKLRQVWLLRSPRRRRRRPEDVEFEVLDSAAQVTEVMSEDAEEQRTLLAVGGEPRNAIVECWHRFERAGGARPASTAGPGRPPRSSCSGCSTSSVPTGARSPGWPTSTARPASPTTR